MSLTERSSLSTEPGEDSHGSFSLNSLLSIATSVHVALPRVLILNRELLI